jgi:hypothetical protein
MAKDKKWKKLASEGKVAFRSRDVAFDFFHVLQRLYDFVGDLDAIKQTGEEEREKEIDPKFEEVRHTHFNLWLSLINYHRFTSTIGKTRSRLRFVAIRISCASTFTTSLPAF